MDKAVSWVEKIQNLVHCFDSMIRLNVRKRVVEDFLKILMTAQGHLRMNKHYSKSVHI